jgi:hypothetical protein
LLKDVQEFHSAPFVAGPFDTGRFTGVPILRKKTFTCRIFVFVFVALPVATSAMALGFEL